MNIFTLGAVTLALLAGGGELPQQNVNTIENQETKNILEQKNIDNSIPLAALPRTENTQFTAVRESAKAQKEQKIFDMLAEKSEKRVENAEVLAYEEAKKNDTTGFDLIYKAAGEQYGISWEVLSAVHLVETGRRGDTSIASYAGAQGPMQFMPATFRAYGVDGDGDGVANIHDVDDAIFSAANYIRANSGHTNIRHALFRYNHSNAYVNKVLGIARSVGYQG